MQNNQSAETKIDVKELHMIERNEDDKSQVVDFPSVEVTLESTLDLLKSCKP